MRVLMLMLVVLVLLLTLVFIFELFFAANLRVESGSGLIVV